MDLYTRIWIKEANSTMLNILNLHIRTSFDVFKSNICHLVKDMGDINFIIEILERDAIKILYDKKWYPEAFYLLAMLDYLSNLHELPLCKRYNNLRHQKLEKRLYLSGVILKTMLDKNDDAKTEAERNAIPKFKKYNIIECNIRDVV